MFAVGNPMPVPCPRPGLTTPRTKGRRPRSRAASSTLPPAIIDRIRVAVMGPRASESSSWPVTSTPRRQPHALMTSTVEAPRAPRQKSAPTWMARMSRYGASTPSKNPTWSRAASSRVNGTTATRAPESANARRRSSLTVSLGAGWALTTSSGSGSNVTATSSTARRPASRAARAKRSRCPRWTPSNAPIATTHGKGSLGTGSDPT